MGMKNKLFEQIDFPIEEYNGINFSTKKEIVIRKNANTKSIFPQMKNQLEINIMESGIYEIKENEMCNKNIKINISKNLTVFFIEKNITKQKVSFNDITFNLEEDVKLKHLISEELEKGFNNRYYSLKKNSIIEIEYISMCNIINETKLVVDLNGINSQVDINLVAIANNKAKKVYQVEVNNNVESTKGEIWQKGVCLNGGKIIFNTTSMINKDCKKAENFQESRILLLDLAAKGEVSPNLLINHHNVLASHSASVSRVNDEELYYFQTRGIDKKMAQYLMTISFVKPLFDKIVDEKLRDKLINKILERLNNV